VILLQFISATAIWGGSEKLMVEIRPYSPTSFQRNIAYLKISYITAFDTINQPTTDLVPSLAECSVSLGYGVEMVPVLKVGLRYLALRYLPSCVACFCISLAGAIQF
jgi:hypothetical protein